MKAILPSASIFSIFLFQCTDTFNKSRAKFSHHARRASIHAAFQLSPTVHFHFLIEISLPVFSNSFTFRSGSSFAVIKYLFMFEEPLLKGILD